MSPDSPPAAPRRRRASSSPTEPVRALGILGATLFLVSLGGGLVYGMVYVGHSGTPVATLVYPDDSTVGVALAPAMNPLRASARVSVRETRLLDTGVAWMHAELAGPDGATVWEARQRLTEVAEHGIGVSRTSPALGVLTVPRAGPHRLGVSFETPAGVRVTSAEVVLRRNVRRMSWPVVGALALAGALGLALAGLGGAERRGR